MDDKERREALFRLGHDLIELKNDLACLPAGVPDSRIRKVMLCCISNLKAFRVKTLSLQSVHVDQCLDVYPLACLRDFGLQILALREIQNKVKDDVHYWKNEVRAFQASAPPFSDDIGVVLAETHEFLIFATFANRIHPVSTLSQFSIAHAVRKAQESQFLKEASYVVSILKAAFSIQEELEKSKTSRPGSTHTVSEATFLPVTALHIIVEWYRDYELSMSSSEKVSFIFLTATSNRTRLILVGNSQTGSTTDDTS